MRVSASVIPAALRGNKADGFAMVMVLAMVTIIGLSTAAMFSVLKPQTESSTKATSKIKTSFEARMASEVMLKNISDNASFVSTLLSLDDANASSAKAEYDGFCRTLLSGELLLDFEIDGLSEIKVTNPTMVNNAVITSYVKQQFFSDNNGDNLDDDGNVGYLVVGCARRQQGTTAQVMEIVNTKGIWRLVRSDQR